MTHARRPRAGVRGPRRPHDGTGGAAPRGWGVASGLRRPLMPGARRVDDVAGVADLLDDLAVMVAGDHASAPSPCSRACQSVGHRCEHGTPSTAAAIPTVRWRARDDAARKDT